MEFQSDINWMFKCVLWVYMGTTGYSYDSSQQLLIKFVLSGQQDNFEIRIPSVHTKAGDKVGHFVWVFKNDDYGTLHNIDIVEKHVPSGRKLRED